MTDAPSLPFGETRGSGPRPRRRILTVTELTGSIRSILESRYAQVWVEGEISNARRWQTGHLYFSLKDRGAQLKAVMFRSRVTYLRFEPADGQHVVARGRVSVYDPKGEYQLVCEHLEPQGLGARQLAYEQLRARLAEEGLFDPARKRDLPALPRKIGVVTSLDGAAVRDVINILTRRYPSAHIVVSPARVQGSGASTEIARALRRLEQLPGVEVVIVTRGGGSVEDLWAFNEEVVARAVSTARVPVISAVGHETDVTICDFVADLRAPTPSAAAELVVAQKDEIATRIRRSEERLLAAVGMLLQHRRTRLHRLERRPGLADWPTSLAHRGRRVAELTHQLSARAATALAGRARRAHAARRRLESLDLGRRLERIQTRLVDVRGRLRQAVDEVVGRRHIRFRAATARLDALSPLGILARGYAVCWTADRSAVIRRSSEVRPGQSVVVTLHQGELDCEIRGTR